MNTKIESESGLNGIWQRFVKFELMKSQALADYAGFVLRIALGSVFIAHALLKLFVLTLPGTVQFFASQGFPGWMAYPVIAGEILGGVFLILGVFTRLAAILLIPIMAGAFLTHYPNGWMFASRGGGWEYIGLLIIALLIQVCLGSGKFSISSVILTPQKRRSYEEPR